MFHSSYKNKITNMHSDNPFSLVLFIIINIILFVGGIYLYNLFFSSFGNDIISFLSGYRINYLYEDNRMLFHLLLWGIYIPIILIILSIINGINNSLASSLNVYSKNMNVVGKMFLILLGLFMVYKLKLMLFGVSVYWGRFLIF
jgi:hypothetical protein